MIFYSKRLLYQGKSKTGKLNRQRGARGENEIRLRFEYNGFKVIKPAMSQGVGDLLITKSKISFYCQVKTKRDDQNPHRDMRSALTTSMIQGLIDHCKIFEMIPLYSYWSGVTGQVIEVLKTADRSTNYFYNLEKYPPAWVKYRSRVRKVMKDKYKWKYNQESVRLLNSVYLWKSNGHKELI